MTSLISPLSRNNHSCFCSCVSCQSAIRTILDSESKFILTRSRMLANDNHSTEKFCIFVFFVCRYNPDTIRARHHRRPLDISLRITLRVFQNIIPINEPIIRNRSLTADPYSGPSYSFTGQYRVIGNCDTTYAQRIIHSHRSTRSILFGHLSIPDVYLKSILAGHFWYICIRCTETIG